MSELLARIARTLTQHWKRSLVAAIVVLILIGAAAGAGGEAADDFEIPGTESQQALDLFRAHSPAFAGADSTIVFSVEDGALTDPEHRAAVEGALEKVQALPHVEQVADPFAEDGTMSQDGRIAAADVRYDLEPDQLEKSDGEALIDAAETAEQGGVEVSARGILIDLASEQEAPVGELVGVGIALILLTVLFRSLAAMAATLIGALIGVMVGQMLLAALAKPLGLPEFASVIAIMLGLGAGIDYSLLIIGRYREQAAAGNTKRDASAKAAGTAGASVVAAGLIVMVAIAGLLVIGIPFIGKLGLASAIAAGVIVLLIFAFPVINMRLGQPDDGNQPEGKTQRVAYDLQSEAFGPGYNGPFLLAVDTPNGAAETDQQLAALGTALEETPGIASVAPPQ